MESSYKLTHLRELESESMFVLREVAAQFENPVLLFSGGKDSIVVAHLLRFLKQTIHILMCLIGSKKNRMGPMVDLKQPHY